MPASCSSRNPALVLGVGAVALAVVGSLAAAAPALAAPRPAPVLVVKYDAVGSSRLAKAQTEVALGPTTLTADITNVTSLAFTGTLPLPETTSSYLAYGLIPVSASVNFEPVGRVVGEVLNGKANATARYRIVLSNVRVGNKTADVGSSCATADPIVVKAVTPYNKMFNLDSGGDIIGAYSIGRFTNCGAVAPLINSTVAGPNNIINLTLSGGRIIPQSAGAPAAPEPDGTTLPAPAAEPSPAPASPVLSQAAPTTVTTTAAAPATTHKSTKHHKSSKARKAKQARKAKAQARTRAMARAAHRSAR